MSTRPPTHMRDKKSFTPARVHRSNKITLTDVQRVKIKIIDGKRCSVRFLLIISYATLANLVAYTVIIGSCYHAIFESYYLKWAFIGFCVDLLVYFFGVAAAVRAIEFAWNPTKFAIGIVSVIFAIIGNIFVAILGNTNSAEYTKGLLTKKLNLCKELNQTLEDEIPDEYKRWGFTPYSTVCQEMETAKTALFFIPIILPPVATIGIVISALAAYYAIYKVPLQLPDVKVDAEWLQPYETYDFYVGRNIPRIPGYDGGYEGTVVDAARYLISDSDSDSESEISEDDSDHPHKKKMGKKQQKKHQIKKHVQGHAH